MAVAENRGIECYPGYDAGRVSHLSQVRHPMSQRAREFFVAQFLLHPYNQFFGYVGCIQSIGVSSW
jgi:hypothetical protein